MMRSSGDRLGCGVCGVLRRVVIAHSRDVRAGGWNKLEHLIGTLHGRWWKLENAY